MLTSKQARDVDEDHHEFDHQPSQSDVEKANLLIVNEKNEKRISRQKSC